MSLDTIITLVLQYGYLLVFVLSVIEGPVVGLIAGFLVSIGDFDPYIIFIVLVLGDLVGDVIYYAIGRYGRESFLHKYGHYIGATPERILRIEKVFEKHDWKLLLFAKTQALGSPILVGAGVAKMPFWPFVWYNFLGTLPKVFLFEVAGLYFGKSYATAAGYLNYVAIGSFIFGAFLVGSYFVARHYLRKQTQELE
jgi:membrane protein DedA with SNARE-associated domain